MSHAHLACHLVVLFWLVGATCAQAQDSLAFEGIAGAYVQGLRTRTDPPWQLGIGRGSDSSLGFRSATRSMTWPGSDDGLSLGLQERSAPGTMGFDSRHLREGQARYRQGAFDLTGSLLRDDDTSLPAQQRRAWSLGAAYRFGDLRLEGAYLALNDQAAVALPSNRNWWVGADYRIGAHLLKVQYLEGLSSDLNGNGGSRARGFGLGYEYALSRQTTLYSALNYFSLKNQDGTGFSRNAFPLAPSLVNSSDGDVTQFMGGVRFRF